jgi:prepilin-type N-terminal cleavage/methylation domain-containing protein
MFKKLTNQDGFTLIELIMVMIILGILAAVAIPKYASTIEKAEEAAESAVIGQLDAGLEVYATEQLLENGRRSWPDNPWETLERKPNGYTVDATDADVDGEWTYNTTSLQVTHQRRDNSRFGWDYDKGTQTGDDADVGTLGDREEL